MFQASPQEGVEVAVGVMVGVNMTGVMVEVEVEVDMTAVLVGVEVGMEVEVDVEVLVAPQGTNCSVSAAIAETPCVYAEPTAQRLPSRSKSKPMNSLSSAAVAVSTTLHALPSQC